MHRPYNLPQSDAHNGGYHPVRPPNMPQKRLKRVRESSRQGDHPINLPLRLAPRRNRRIHRSLHRRRHNISRRGRRDSLGRAGRVARPFDLTKFKGTSTEEISSSVRNELTPAELPPSKSKKTIKLALKVALINSFRRSPVCVRRMTTWVTLWTYEGEKERPPDWRSRGCGTALSS